ncbi:MAG: discoidin domain-containing protein [Candidatus Sericytochromatia bacterium]
MKNGRVWVASALVALGAVGSGLAWQGSRGADAVAVAKSEPTLVARTVDSDHAFGFQYVPKFDEAAGKGAWKGTRDRGVAMHHDLGVQVSREGFLWRHYEPNSLGGRPNMADFDDVVDRLNRSGIALEAMVTETPLWASSAPNPDPKNPASYKSAPPKGLNQPIFTDGTDTPGPGKKLNPKNTWASALGHMVDRYQGQIRYWQMWNEPDYPKGDQKADYADKRRSWNGSVDDYVRMLKVGHTVVKFIDPKAQVVTGGIGFGPYLQAMLDRGAGAYFDHLDFHAYGWPGSDTALAQFVKVHDEMRAVLQRNGLDNKGLICSETGYTALQPETQAAYIAKLYPTAIAMGVESTMYYANVNPSWKTMGLVDWRTLSQRTAGYWAYKNASTALKGVRRVVPLSLANAKGFRFERGDGTAVYVVWAPNKTADKPQPTNLALPAGAWQLRDAVGRPLGQARGTASLKLTASPVWIDSDAKRAYAPIRPNPPLARQGLPLAEAMADSANEDAGTPFAAIDTDTDSHWASGKIKHPTAWLSLGFQQETAVKRLKLKTGPTPRGTWFDVEASLDGKTFKPVLSRVRLDSWKMETLEFPSAVRAKVIRLTWHNPEKKAAHFSVFEAEAH